MSKNPSKLCLLSYSVRSIYVLISFLVLECWEYKNKYDVVDESGSKVFFLQEESDFCSRMWCANARPLQVSFQDTEGQELLRFDRPLRCMQCCIPAFYPNYTQVKNLHQF